MFNEFEEKLDKLNRSYSRRKNEEDKIWRGYDTECISLTSIVEREFLNLVKGIELNKGTKIMGAKAEYIPKTNKLTIDITYGKTNELPVGRNWNCAYVNYAGILTYSSFKEEKPQVREFRKKYNVESIGCECDCGSDHK